MVLAIYSVWSQCAWDKPFQKQARMIAWITYFVAELPIQECAVMIVALAPSPGTPCMAVVQLTHAPGWLSTGMHWQRTACMFIQSSTMDKCYNFFMHVHIDDRARTALADESASNVKQKYECIVYNYTHTWACIYTQSSIVAKFVLNTEV